MGTEQDTGFSLRVVTGNDIGILQYLEDERVAQQLEYYTELIHYKASTQEDISQCWNEILEILNGGLALTQEQQKEFEALNEIY